MCTFILLAHFLTKQYLVNIGGHNFRWINPQNTVTVEKESNISHSTTAMIRAEHLKPLDTPHSNW